MTSTTAPKFTLSGAQSIETPAQAKRYLGQSVKVWNSEEVQIEKRNNIRSAVVAYAIHAGIRVGYIGGTEGLKGLEVAAMYGRSAAWVTSMKTLGVAFVDCQIDPASDTGRTLVNGAIQNGDVSKAVKADGANAESVAKVLADLGYQISGKRAQQVTNAAQRAAGGNADQTQGEGEPRLPRNNSTRIDMIETLLAAMSKPSKAERDRLTVTFTTWGEAFNLTLTAPEPLAETA